MTVLCEFACYCICFFYLHLAARQRGRDGHVLAARRRQHGFPDAARDAVRGLQERGWEHRLPHRGSPQEPQDHGQGAALVNE